jgi:hypothetical protein
MLLNHKYFGQGQDFLSSCLALVCVLTVLVGSLNNDLSDCKGGEGRIDSKYREMYPPAVLVGRCDFDRVYLPKKVAVAGEVF